MANIDKDIYYDLTRLKAEMNVYTEISKLLSKHRVRISGEFSRDYQFLFNKKLGEIKKIETSLESLLLNEES